MVAILRSVGIYLLMNIGKYLVKRNMFVQIDQQIKISLNS
jgi:hypothetical protein